MSTVLNVRDNGVTIGVTDKNLQFIPELREVTFADVFGAIHSVFAHKEGPFQAIEDIIAAHQAGTLHTFPDHESAIDFHTQQGDTTTADRIRSLTTQSDDDGDRKQGS